MKPGVDDCKPRKSVELVPIGVCTTRKNIANDKLLPDPADPCQDRVLCATHASLGHACRLPVEPFRLALDPAMDAWRAGRARCGIW
ncbi:MAG: hypothetical protein ACTHM8_13340 [Sphingomonas sp.]